MVRAINQIGSKIANNTAFEKFVGVLERTDNEQENVFRVLTYHRVDEPDAHPGLDPGLISASPETFKAQMKYLAANYETVSIFDVIKAFESEGQAALPPRAVIITFDDAYNDFLQYAWPVLRQYRIPATLFVPTAFPDHPERLFWWDRVFNAIHGTEKRELNTSIGLIPISTEIQRERAHRRLMRYIKRLPNEIAMKEVNQICDELGVPPHVNCVLGWNALRQLAKEGVTLGAHTQTHPIMNTISLDDMQKETIGSKQDLLREIGSDPQVFAYPSGTHNDHVVKTVEKAGFALAFTTERGINKVGRAHHLRIRRINVGKRTTIPILRAQLLSWTENLYSLSGNFF